MGNQVLKFHKATIKQLGAESILFNFKNEEKKPKPKKRKRHFRQFEFFVGDGGNVRAGRLPLPGTPFSGFGGRYCGRGGCGRFGRSPEKPLYLSNMSKGSSNAGTSR